MISSVYIVGHVLLNVGVRVTAFAKRNKKKKEEKKKKK